MASGLLRGLYADLADLYAKFSTWCECGACELLPSGNNLPNRFAEIDVQALVARNFHFPRVEAELV